MGGFENIAVFNLIILDLVILVNGFVFIIIGKLENFGIIIIYFLENSNNSGVRFCFLVII